MPIGNSPGINNVRKLIRRVSRCDYPVIIRGETRVGKTLTARIIHLASFRKDRTFFI
ncbi:MAG TPA: hypothetical protein ENL38_07795 [Candidatus Aminicenantes bacterium]|nr:hypothetical protein [Candidatus Aminicenantes bacterium]